MSKILYAPFIWMLLNHQALSGDTFSVSGSPAGFTVSSATAGFEPTAPTNDTSTNYNITTQNFVRKITGKINTPMSNGTILQIQLEAPPGATTAGLVTMTTTAADLVTAIPNKTTANALTITYAFSATVAAAQVSGATKTLTLTIQ
jgi:hypothetical protein